MQVLKINRLDFENRLYYGLHQHLITKIRFYNYYCLKEQFEYNFKQSIWYLNMCFKLKTTFLPLKSSFCRSNASKTASTSNERTQTNITTNTIR